MSVDAATLVFAVLAVAAQLAVAGVLLVALASSVSPDASRLAARVRDAVAPDAVGLALVVASVATAGSLYFSEVAHFTPCRLCWVQRAAMYPLVPLLAWVAWRGSAVVRRVVLALALVGGLVSSYHVLIERFPTMESSACDPSNPCSLIWTERFGYLTIPTMALSAFALIATLLLLGAGPRLRAGAPALTANERG